MVSSCLTNPSNPKGASNLLAIALNVRSLSSSRGGAGLDLRSLLNIDLSLPLPLPTALPPPLPLPLLLLLPLPLLGGRGLLLSLLRLGSELLLEEPNFGEPLDLDIDFDVLLELEELLLLGMDEDEEDVEDDEGVFEGLDVVLSPELVEEFPLLPLPLPLPLLLDGILGRPGEDEEVDEDVGFLDAGPLFTPGLRPV